MKKRNFNSIRRRPVKPSKNSQPISTLNMFQRREREGHIDVLNTAATTEKFQPKVPPARMVIVSEDQREIITVLEDRNTLTTLENPASRSEVAALMPANEERNTTGVIDDPIAVDSHPNDLECNELVDNNPSFSVDQSEDSDIRQMEHVQAELPAALQNCNNEEPPMERQEVHEGFRVLQSLEVPHQEAYFYIPCN